MPLVTFLPSGTTVEVDPDSDLLHAGLKAGIRIATACGGVASCTECRVVVEAGEEHLSPMEFNEQAMLGNVFFITKERLACQTRVQGEVTVRVCNEVLADKRGKARERTLRRDQENLVRAAARRDERATRDKERGRRSSPERGSDTDGSGSDGGGRRRRSRAGSGNDGSARKGSGEQAGAPRPPRADGDPAPPRRRRRRRRRSGGGDKPASD